jgi:hypothetical protein
MLAFAIGGEVVRGSRRVAAGPWSIVANVHPNATFLDAAVSGSAVRRDTSFIGVSWTCNRSERMISVLTRVLKGSERGDRAVHRQNLHDVQEKLLAMRGIDMVARLARASNDRLGARPNGRRPERKPGSLSR